MKLTLQIWRQKDGRGAGKLVTYEMPEVSPDMSFLEMLDVLNERLMASAQEPVAFDHDCREGICGSCGFMINGIAHGPKSATTVCQLHMRSFKDGDVLVIEPWRSRAFPVLRDLVVDRGAFDRIVAAGGFITAPTGSARDANGTLVPKTAADLAMDAAACIGCGACVASCPNGSAMLFTAAKVSHLGRLPQGQPEAHKRVAAMVAQMDKEGFGSCSNIAECEAVCPKEIDLGVIAHLNRQLMASAVLRRPESKGGDGA
jgi:succinate dehydrogenase / fumarate reductase iron-sulfur subunit